MPERLALVTGAAGAIGSGVSSMLRSKGYRLIAVDIDAAAVDRAVATIGDDTIGAVCDARDRDDVIALANRIRGEWADRFEVLVCNAGLIVPGSVGTFDPAELAAQVDVMLACPVQLMNAAVPGMRARGRGRLLATVSMGGIISLPGSATYSAAKAGLRAFLTALSAELTGTGVRVAGVYPSGVDTPMLRLEARHGGSMLNFVGKVFSVPDVVEAFEKALTGRRLEVYLPYSDSITTRVANFVPGASNRIIPLFERFGRRGHAKYLARIDAEEAADTPVG
ncbi:MAG TPA: SDR family oxidoreductase [Nakamurella sp.]